MPKTEKKMQTEAKRKKERAGEKNFMKIDPGACGCVVAAS